MTSSPDSEQESGILNPKTRPSRSPLASLANLPYRSSNTSLSNLFASTTYNHSESSPQPSASTAVNGSVLSPGGSTVRSPSPGLSTKPLPESGDEVRNVIVRAFSPCVSLLASEDCEELVRHKGIDGGLLELLRPFGECVPGKVTIRDSSGVSRSWEDFGVRFTGVKDGLENPRGENRNSTDSASSKNGRRASMLEYKPARLRSGGDVPQIEDLVERHLTFAEEHSGPFEADYINHKDTPVSPGESNATSPFYLLYLRRLLSGLPLVPSETLSHPVASVIAISSRSQSPIEELRTLYASSNTGEHRLPQWVHNEFLRYYVLIHDEDYDDIQKSMNLYDQMKRHFGLHCHLLRLRSTQCVPSDDDTVKLPSYEWTAAAEELWEIVRRETNEDGEDPTPCIFESDATAIRAFVREMVTQSIIPSMERASASWNDQVASRRRGISGRFMSISKRLTTFGSNRNSSIAAIGGGGSNYDSLQGFYRPDAPEAVMRRLADYSMMLRDFKLAQSTYEILCQDFKNDKAWRYHAAANEMAAVSSLIVGNTFNSKMRLEAVDQYLEAAYYSYITRVGAPYNALRTLMLGAELLKLRGGSALYDAVRWSSKILDDHLVGSIGHVLLIERIAACYTDRQDASALLSGEHKRKAGFWSMLACDAWLRLDKGERAERCISEATRLYRLSDEQVKFDEMKAFLLQLQNDVKTHRSGPQHINGEELLANEQIEILQEESEIVHRRASVVGLTSISPLHSRGKSLGVANRSPEDPTSFDPLNQIPSAYENTPDASTAHPGGIYNAKAVAPQPKSPLIEMKKERDDGFE